MDRKELSQMILQRSQKLKPLRTMIFNSNQEKKRSHISALINLLNDQSELKPVYEQITLLLTSANLQVVSTVSEDVLGRVVRIHKNGELDEFILLWGRMYDGTLEKKFYPNVKYQLKSLNIKRQNRQLEGQYKKFYFEFQRNYNHQKNERVEFFDDFDEQSELFSNSIDNDSRLSEIVYYDIMEIKSLRKKIQTEKLTQQSHNEVINKMKYFLSLKRKNFPVQLREQFERQSSWMKNYVEGINSKVQKKSKISINQTFALQSRDEEQIQIVDKTKYSQKRTFKETQQNFKKKINQDIVQVKENINQQFYREPKRVYQPKFTSEQDRKSLKQSRNSMRNSIFLDKSGNKYVPKNQQKEKRQKEENYSDIAEEELIIKKYNPKNFNSPKIKNPFKEQQKAYFTANRFTSPMKLQMKSPSQAHYYQTQTKWNTSRMMSPSSRPSKYKLSEFTSQKKKRRIVAPKEELSIPDDYVIKSYANHFEHFNDFCKFRRNCFESSFTLYASSYLLVSCNVKKDRQSEVKFQIIFSNQSRMTLNVESVYKIPKCFKIQKKTKISKKFELKDMNQHVFTLDMQQFPLQICFLSLKYGPSKSTEGVHSQIPIPTTLINFVEILELQVGEWIKSWERLNNPANKRLLHINKHLQYDKNIVDNSELQSILGQFFVSVGNIEGYSIEEFGGSCYYSHLDHLKFLIRFSIRVDNIISLEVVTERQVTENEYDFVEYYVNVWMMLIGKLY